MASLATVATASSLGVFSAALPRAESALGFSSSVRFAPIHAKPSRLQTSGKRTMVVMAAQQDVKDISDKIAAAVEQAKETCAGAEGTGECAAAWDDVEELSAARAHKAALDKELKTSDPLEIYCKDNPETDECRIYSD